ncbi:hypothetical protein E2C01_068493 [Portunus trituberculatus]|uniref:Uncharacterized protein n=1 Tax=Portunus trituberculatus TaxID=210409 RepID=A0A5B7I080_PORTR|nr:hypothetical protein [Portunus trituberculatus]
MSENAARPSTSVQPYKSDSCKKELDKLVVSRMTVEDLQPLSVVEEKIQEFSS